MKMRTTSRKMYDTCFNSYSFFLKIKSREIVPTKRIAVALLLKTRTYHCSDARS